MDHTHRVDINGRQYDPVTGLPVDGDASKEAPRVEQPKVAAAIRSVQAGSIHAHTQRSTTLRRSSLKKPEKQVLSARATSSHVIQPNKKPATVHPTIAKSPQVTKFAPRAVVQAGPRMMDVAPMRHHQVLKAQAQLDAKHAEPVVKPSQVLKQEAIRDAIENTVKPKPIKRHFFRRPALMSILTASIAFVILGGYLTYLNMPSLSVRVAAAAAGIDASYPNYRPDGYHLNGAVAYDQGQVSMQFVASAGPQNFTVKQSKSSWDSAAVLNDYVVPKAGNDYTTYSDHGLTIYTFDGGAAWVNGGILYTIQGNAPLSSEQIRHLATSFS